MQIIKDIEQGSDEWKVLRLGVITGSNFSAVLAGGSGKTRRSYMVKLAAEILTGEPVESYSNAAMEWGVETEPQARAMYELESASEVVEVSFIKHDTICAGVSPDGLVGDDGLVEFKCPNTTTQIETYLKGDMPTTHRAQVQGQLWVSEREWCDFVSFDPRINGKSSYFKKRIERDNEYINNLLWPAVVKFNTELNEVVERLRDV